MECVNKLFHQTSHQIGNYRTYLQQNPEECKRRALIGTLALGAIAFGGVGLAVGLNSLSSMVFAPMVVGYVQAAWLIHSFDLSPQGSEDKAIAKEMKQWIHVSLISLSVFGAGSTAVLLSNLSGFAALFALLTAGTCGASFHFDSLPSK